MRLTIVNLFYILCSIITILVLITWTFKRPNIGYEFKLQQNNLAYPTPTPTNTQQVTTNLATNYLRYLFPQIWACQSPNFKGKPDYYSQFSEDKALHKWIFNNTKQNENPGIFVELGALDGLAGSNTLFFERMFDWRGVLIEAQPENAKQLLKADRRKTVKLPIGICSPPRTYIRMLGGPGYVAGNIDTMDPDLRSKWHGNNDKTINVSCGPIGSYLTAIGITHIDFFSLDVEGSE
ncbi:unnamed protein product, partial [Rotaria sp. Silwood1]